MIPDPGNILRRRVTAATVVRLFALVPLTVSVGVATAWVVQSFVWGVGRDEHIVFSITVGIPLLFAALLWAVAPWGARVSVRPPASMICPRCGYHLDSITSPQCTECGLPLTDEFMPGAEQQPARDPDLPLIRLISTTVIRLFCLMSLFVIVPITLTLMMQYIEWGFDGLFEIGSFMIMVGLSVTLAIVGLGARFIAIAIVPPRHVFERPEREGLRPGQSPEGKQGPPPVGGEDQAVKSAARVG